MSTLRIFLDDTYFPSVRGWINWWALPVHAVLIFPSVRRDLLKETDEMYGRLPSTNNNSEGTNSMESHLCKHNVELVPAIMDSWRVTKRQEKLHEGVLTGKAICLWQLDGKTCCNSHFTPGQVKTKVSPVKLPVLTKRRELPKDFDLPCPTRCPEKGKPGKRQRSSEADADDTVMKTVAKKGMVLKEHTEDDRCARVNALISASKATLGFFLEIFPSEEEVDDAGERWFAEVTESKIYGVFPSQSVKAKWCKTNTLSPEVPYNSTQILLKNLKDYGPKGNFI
jgi:hypothetical protein